MMSDKKISQLTAATTPLAGTEVLPIVQSGATVKVANNDLRPKQIQSNATTGILQVSGPAAGSTRIMTTPDANFVAARTDASQTFTGNQTINGTVSVIPSNWGSPASAGIAYFGDTNNFVSGVFGGSFNLSGYDKVDISTNVFGNVVHARFDAVGNLAINNGNLVIGTSGKGIDFSADGQAAGMTSELLDDYEEGTFTPTVTSGSGTITSFTLGDCFYTKIGRVVTINFAVTITDAGTGAGNLNVSLPFTNGASAGNGTGRENALTGNQLQTRVSPSSAEMNIQTYNNLSTIATNAAILATLTYFV